MRSSLLLFLLLIVLSINAGAQSWEWAKGAKMGTAASMSVGECYTNATDGLGNTYATGALTNGTYVFGNDTFNIVGQAAFLSRHNRDGKIMWTRVIKKAAGNGVAVDKLGNVYFSGDFQGDSITLGGVSIIHSPATAYKDFFIYKLDSSGNAIWGRGGGACTNDMGKVVATDGADNVYFACGFVSDSVKFGPYTLHNVSTTGYRDVCVAKYNPSGTVIWARRFGASSGEFVLGISTDDNAHVYIAGMFMSSSFTFGPSTVYKPGMFNAYVAKYDTAGNELLAIAPNAGGYNMAYSAAADDDGNIYMAGEYDSAYIKFGADTLRNSHPTIPNGYFAKFNAAGTPVWSKNFEAWGADRCFVVRKGKYSQDMWLSGGFTSDTVNINGYTLREDTVNGNDNAFAILFDSSGIMKCIMTMGTGGDDNIGLDLDDSGYVYMGGDYYANTIIGSDTLLLTGTSQEVPFVAKLKPCMLPNIPNPHDPNHLSVINTAGSEAALTLMPNPVRYQLTAEIGVKENACMNISIYNVLGRKIYTERQCLNSGYNTVDIQVEKLPAGVYVFELQGEAALTRRMFIKE